MRPEDRLVIRSSNRLASGEPQIKELEWRYATSDLWVGRLPRATNNPAAAPPTN
jgi:hypothetical protein